MDAPHQPMPWPVPTPGAPLHALTIPEPLASATLDCGRDVDSRPWHAAPHHTAQARRLLNQPLLIHAGSRFERHWNDWVYRHGGQRYWPTTVTPSAVIGVVTLAAVDEYSESAWYEPGRLALTFRHPMRFDVPIPVRGQQGLWVPDALVQERVRRQMQFQLSRAS